MKQINEMKITKQQKAVLEVIYNFINKNHYPPTVRDISEKMGFSSPKAASDHIKALDKKGFIIHRITLNNFINMQYS